MEEVLKNDERVANKPEEVTKAEISDIEMLDQYVGTIMNELDLKQQLISRRIDPNYIQEIEVSTHELFEKRLKLADKINHYVTV